jgi:hypothetical protein
LVNGGILVEGADENGLGTGVGKKMNGEFQNCTLQQISQLI